MKTSALFYICLFGVVLVQAQIGGYALQFDGTDDYVNLGDVDVTGSEITVEAWLYPTQFGPNSWSNTIIGNGYDEEDIEIYHYGFDFRFGKEGKLSFVFGYHEDWVEVCSNSNALTLNKWQHVAVTYNGSTLYTLYLYVNGVQVASQGTEGKTLSASENNLLMGAHPFFDDNYYRRMQGKLDEVRVWNIARTADQIKANMYKEIGTHTNLEAYYKMSDGTGTSLTDDSGNSHTGTLTNGPTWKTSGCFAGARNCLDFDGVNDYVSIPDNSAHEPASLTLEAWILVNGNGTTKTGGHDKQFMCFKKNTRTDYFEGYVIYYAENDKSFKGGVSSSAGSQKLISTPANSIDFSTWYHVALVADNTDLTLYLNGISQGTTSTGFALDYGSDPLYF